MSGAPPELHETYGASARPTSSAIFAIGHSHSIGAYAQTYAQTPGPSCIESENLVMDSSWQPGPSDGCGATSSRSTLRPNKRRRIDVAWWMPVPSTYALDKDICHQLSTQAFPRLALGDLQALRSSCRALRCEMEAMRPAAWLKVARFGK